MNVFRVMRLHDLFTLLNVVFGFLALLAAGGAWGGNSLNYAGYGNKNENLSIHDQPYLLNGFLLVLLKITIDNGLM